MGWREFRTLSLEERSSLFRAELEKSLQPEFDEIKRLLPKHVHGVESQHLIWLAFLLSDGGDRVDWIRDRETVYSPSGMTLGEYFLLLMKAYWPYAFGYFDSESNDFKRGIISRVKEYHDSLRPAEIYLLKKNPLPESLGEAVFEIEEFRLRSHPDALPCKEQLIYNIIKRWMSGNPRSHVRKGARKPRKVRKRGSN